MTSSAVSPSDGREQPSLSCAEAEQARLRALRRYEIVGTEPESNFDRITRVAASLFEVPIALINFVAEGQRWCKSAVGVESGGRSHRSSFCIEVVRSGETIVIEGAAEMERFSDHPLVEGPPGVRFYAGAPLETPDGHLIGTLCVLDTTPRRLSSEEVGRLEDLAEMVMSELEQRRRIRKRLRQKDECPQSIAENVSEGIYRSTPEGELTYVNQAFAEMFGYDSVEEILEVDPDVLYADPAERARVLEKTNEQNGLDEENIEFRRADGSTFVGRVTDTVVQGEDGEVSHYDGVVADVTEQKRRERKLRETSATLEAILENLPPGVLVEDADRTIVAANQGLCDVFGISASPDDLEGTDCAEAAGEMVSQFEEPGRFADRAEKLLEKGAPVEREELRLADGRVLERDFVPYTLAGEEAALWLFRDVTERKRREQELREGRQRLREEKKRIQAITENVSDGIYRSAAEEGIIYANQAFIEMSGYRDLEELKAAESKALYADLAQRETLIEKETEEGRLDREEVQFRRKDGTTFVGLLSSQQVEGEDQEKVYFDGAVTDITERKRHEEKLERRQRNIEALYETTRSLLRAESREAVCDRIHGVLRRVFDYDPVNVGFLEEGAVRSARTDRSGDVEAPAPRPADGNSIAAQVLRNGETTVVTDLDSSENDVGFGAVRSAAGVPIGEQGVIVVGRVEEKSFDRFNLRLVEVLAGYAALVLGRLEREDELREAKEEAEEAARLKASMLANMSHEIRTPLTSIIGFSEAIGEAIEMLEDRPDEAGLSQLARFATLIEQAGTRLLRTLDGVLNLSKLEAEEIEMDACPVDLAEQVRQAASELRPKAEEVGLDLRVEAGDTCAWANEGGVQIVLQNLLSNAIKYTGEGGEVRVRSCQNEDEAILIVEDTGIGMELEVAETLFEPFRQASEGLDRDYEGTGIGLAVVKRAVEQMDGTVDVKTQKGEGSRFTVRFPRAGKGGKSR